MPFCRFKRSRADGGVLLDHFYCPKPHQLTTERFFALLAQNSPTVPEIVPKTQIFLVRLCQMLHVDTYDTVMLTFWSLQVLYPKFSVSENQPQKKHKIRSSFTNKRRMAPNKFRKKHLCWVVSMM